MAALHHRRTHTRLLACLPAVALLAGCATWNTARPLPEGQHRVSATALGPPVLLGGTPLPLPTLALEGRSGLAPVAGHAVDVAYGLQATGLLFGVVAGHVGGAALLLHQSGAVPALSLAVRQHWAANLFGRAGKRDTGVKLWTANEAELTASWLAGGQLLYLSLSQTTDLFVPQLLLTPAFGAQLGPREAGAWQVQLELAWWGVNRSKITNSVNWLSQRGAPGLSVGVSYGF